MEKLYDIKFSADGLSTTITLGKQRNWCEVTLVDGYQHGFPNCTFTLNKGDDVFQTSSHLGAYGLMALYDGALALPANQRFQKLNSIRRFYLRLIRCGKQPFIKLENYERN